jgi:hypothetical protein
MSLLAQDGEDPVEQMIELTRSAKGYAMVDFPEPGILEISVAQ